MGSGGRMTSVVQKGRLPPGKQVKALCDQSGWAVALGTLLNLAEQTKS